MRLSEKNFFKGDGLYTHDGKTYAYKVYSYETKDKLYDVRFCEGYHQYRINCQVVQTRTSIHAEIEEHFNI